MSKIERIKIKKVEIQAFRAYEKLENSTFDFTAENGEISNFVALYAPNGFGKTSFYDAVEWGMTNNIRRFLKNKNENLLSAKAENSMYILRNHNAEQSLDSYVKITAECGGEEYIFPRTLPHNLRRNQRDARFDKKETDSERVYFLDVLLSQDDISSFLKEDDSASRYEKFVTAFGDKELDKNYKLITELLAKNKEKIKNHANEILALEKEIVTDVDDNIIAKINEIIIRLESQGVIIPQLKSNISAKDDELLDLSIIENSNSVLSKKVILSNEIENLHKIINSENEFDLNKYSIILEEIENADIKINQLYFILKKWRLYNKRNKLLSKINEIINSSLSESEDINKLKYNIDYYFAKNKSISIARKKVKELEGKVEILSSNIDELELNKAKVTSELNSAIKDLSIYSKYKNDLNFDFQKNNLAEELVMELDSKIHNLHKGIVNNKNKVEALISDGKYWGEIKETVEAEGFSGKIITKDEVINKKIRSLVYDLKAKDVVINELSSLIKKIKITDHLGEKLNGIINIGLEFILESGSHHCPLCSTDHKNLDSLVNKIKNNPLLSDQHKQLIVDKDNLHSRIKEYDEKIVLHSEEIKNKILNLIFNINEHIGYESDNILKNEDKLTVLMKEREASLEVINSFKTKTCNLSKKEYNKWLDENIKIKNSHHISLKNEINIIDSKINFEKTNKNTFTEQISLLLSSINESHIDERYCFIVDLLDRRAWNNISKKFITFKEKCLTKKILKAKKLSNQLQVNIFNISLSLPSEGFNIISEDLHSLEIKKIELINKKDNFLVKMSNVLNIPIDNITNNPIKLSKIIMEQINSHSNSLDYLNETLLGLKSLSDIKDTLSIFIIRKENKEKIKKIQGEIIFLKEIYNKKLVDQQSLISKKIKKDISDFFYIDLINTFYSKIDPHPRYKNISFSCDFSSDKPRLHVFVKSEEKSIIPTLYFSAAQLNSLSLSIFLAKALNVHDPLTGRVVDCVFIDDPIQAMDSINILSVIDLLRSISFNLGKQIILSTHDANFYNLLKKKVPHDKFNSCFIELESYGIVKR